MSEPEFTYEDGNYLLDLGKRINQLLSSGQRNLDSRFAEKFASNPGVVTRAELEEVKGIAEHAREQGFGIFNGDLTTQHTLDLRFAISKLEVRLKDLEADARSRGVMLP